MGNHLRVSRNNLLTEPLGGSSAGNFSSGVDGSTTFSRRLTQIYLTSWPYRERLGDKISLRVSYRQSSRSIWEQSFYRIFLQNLSTESFYEYLTLANNLYRISWKVLAWTVYLSKASFYEYLELHQSSVTCTEVGGGKKELAAGLI